MPRITPQDAHQEMLRMSHDLPEDWSELTDEQIALFVEIARNLNRIADGESIRRPPTRRILIKQHQRDIDELASKPMRMGSFAERFMESSINNNMMQYHKAAIKYLESGGDIEQTIDALSTGELEEMMRAQGYFVCYREDDE